MIDNELKIEFGKALGKNWGEKHGIVYDLDKHKPDDVARHVVTDNDLAVYAIRWMQETVRYDILEVMMNEAILVSSNKSLQKELEKARAENGLRVEPTTNEKFNTPLV